MTPTPTPTPIPGVNWYWDVQTSAPLTAGAVWAVLVLLLIVTIFQRKQRILQGVQVITLVSLPLALVNAGWWALTVYLFVSLFILVGGILRIGD